MMVSKVGKKFLKEKSIKTESKGWFTIPLTLEKTWNVDSETYLILRKYPYMTIGLQQILNSTTKLLL